ncbi:hypothetical protein [Rhizobium sullae]|uniref:Uncharacterized protein n=1 Tax=Rhizobium sullae TaxID=50338 RepID=A0ABY5XRX7_RHISU|nr:hypothetical protein [Rhizobium sullae]UWU16851.1 hypothetical protein N2599_28925 [Rhizobium sullae]
MDFHILVAAHMGCRRHPQRMSAAAEDQYYGDKSNLLRPSVRLLAPIAVTAGMILLLVGLSGQEALPCPGEPAMLYCDPLP